MRVQQEWVSHKSSTLHKSFAREFHESVPQGFFHKLFHKSVWPFAFWVRVCIRVRGLHLVSIFWFHSMSTLRLFSIELVRIVLLQARTWHNATTLQPSKVQPQHHWFPHLHDSFRVSTVSTLNQSSKNLAMALILKYWTSSVLQLGCKLNYI